MKCKKCDKEFMPSRYSGKKQSFCSKECQRTWWKEEYRRRRKIAGKSRGGARVAGERMSVKGMEKLKAEYKEKDCKKHLKNYCVSCGEPIKQSWEHCLIYGNYCPECDRRITENCKRKRYYPDPNEYITQSPLEIGSECRNT